MQVIIDEVISRVRAIDGSSALPPEKMREMVEAVLAAVHEQARHDDQVQQERSLQNGYLDRLGSAGR